MVDLNPVASNRTDLGRTVAGSINEMLEKYRLGANGEKNVSIATAYINPAGYALIAEELGKVSRVRLLIGAEPDFGADNSVIRGDQSAELALRSALNDHEIWLAAERDLAGFTKKAVSSAQQMVEWLESNSNGIPVVEVRRFNKGFLHGKSYLIEADLSSSVIAGSSNFTHAGLSVNAELNLATSGSPGHVKDVREWFDHYWDQSDEFDLAELYKTQWAPHQPWTIFLRMLQELYGPDMSDEGATGRLGLTEFQRDGVARMRRLLKQNGGVLVADEVGLGKSYLAGEVIKTATEENYQRALIICPAALKKSMWMPFLKDHNFKYDVAVFSFEEIRNRMKEPEAPEENASVADRADYKDKLRNWEKFKIEIASYALVVVDEAHNLRNSATSRAEAIDRVLLSGKHPKQVILLTATPVNNSLSDLETLIKYFVRNDAQFANIGIPSIRSYIKRAQDTDPDNLTPEHLFDLMDQVAVRRTRKFVKENYGNDKVVIRGVEQTIKFPTARSYRIEYELDEDGKKLVDAMLYALEVDELEVGNNSYNFRRGDVKHLMLARYTPSAYRVSGDLESHQITNAGLLRSALLKRLESSPAALERTLLRLSTAHETFIKALKAGFVIIGAALSELTNTEDDDFINVLEELDVENRRDVELASEYRLKELLEDVESDKKLIDELRLLASAARTGSDPKYNELVRQLIEIAKASKSIEPVLATPGDRRKVIVFSTYADTIHDLFERLSIELETTQNPDLLVYKGRLAPPIMGTYASTLAAGDSGGVDQGGRASTLAEFAPETAGEYDEDGNPIDKDLFDILFTTDVLSEGVNLQQAGQIVNYDLPWNPMRIVQRHGRIDRIGSKHDYVHLGLFFPADLLNEMLQLEATLQRKLAQANAAVGEHIEVLAKSKDRFDVILHDKSMKEMDAFLEARGGDNAISGEEFRRRLFKYMNDHPQGTEASRLPFGSGSGFINTSVPVTGYAFCAKIGEHGKPWFRFVKTDKNWDPEIREDGSVVMSSESLVALKASDPRHESTPRDLSDEAYSKAFDSWQLAKNSILLDWNHLADARNIGTKAPASFRKAFDYISQNCTFLEAEELTQLLKRLSAVPSRKIELAVGRALNQEASSDEIIKNIIQILDDGGIQAPPKPEPLPAVNEHEVRLVVWMAVQGSK